MENILLKYMIERFNTSSEGKPIQEKALPFITISREYGCPAMEIANIIINKLNEANASKKNFCPWTSINKEILEAASADLNIDPTRIAKVFNDEKRGAIDEILNALSEKYYKSDLTILHTIDAVTADFAKKGNVVIIGRGIVAVTRTFDAGFHVRLFAPSDWRAQRILQKENCNSLDDAQFMVRTMDLNRKKLLNLKGINVNKDDWFDVYYNCKYLSVDEIADAIIHHLKMKNLI